MYAARIQPPKLGPCRVKTTGWIADFASRIAMKLTGISTTPNSAYTALKFSRCGPGSTEKRNMKYAA